MRTGVFGGTFNPVHYGHLRAAEEARIALDLDRLLFVPAGTPPLKHEDLAGIEERVRMVELAIEDNPFFELSMVEAHSAGKSYTVDTLDILAREHPEDSFVFILGVDAFCDVHLWKNPEGLMAAADFLVLSRSGHSFAPISRLPYADLPEGAFASLDSGDILYIEGSLRGGRRLYLLRITEMGVSATLLRELLRRGESVRYLLPEAVESFIMSNGLYRGSEGR
jgi:nicotinate-nucleotide adenylyltransferase